MTDPPRGRPPRVTEPPAAELPYWRLSSFYLFYFATLGALVPYWGLYLESLGLGPERIGELMGILSATKVVAPYVWGWLADHSGRRMTVIRVASLLSAVTFAGVLLGTSYAWLALVMVAFSFFWNAALPQFEATTLNHLGTQPHGYTRIRLWGSVGFIITVVVMGHVVERHGVTWLPPGLLLLLAGIWLASLVVPEGVASRAELPHRSLGRTLRQPAVLALLGACLLIQLSHGPYYTFYSIYLKDYAYPAGLIGALWALGVIAEVVLFVLMPRLLRRYGLRRPFLLSFAVTSLRWVLIALFPGHLGVLLFAQTLHAASFGLYHAVAIQLIHRHFTGPLQGRGQALYSSLSFGAGGALGSLGSGYAWEGLGGGNTFLLAALASALGLAVVWRWVDGEAGGLTQRRLR